MANVGWAEAGVVMFLAFTAVSVLFLVLYTVLSPWWKTPTGRNIMTLMAALAGAGVYFSWAYFNGGTPPAYYPVRFGIFTVLFLAVTWRVVLFVRAQVLCRRASRSEERIPK